MGRPTLANRLRMGKGLKRLIPQVGVHVGGLVHFEASIEGCQCNRCLFLGRGNDACLLVIAAPMSSASCILCLHALFPSYLFNHVLSVCVALRPWS